MSDQNLIDKDTKVLTMLSHHDKRLHNLVMSDEYNTDGRDFGVGNDKIFEAIQKPDYTNQAIQFYNSSKSYVTTSSGSLKLITRAVKTTYTQPNMFSGRPETVTKNYTSGMVQSWNKFCFTGGILEMSIRLPGHGYSGGLWAAAWLMGQLSRATFEGTTMNIWPWSYNKCDKKDQLNHLSTKQMFSACDSNPKYGFKPNQGRGAPEIDIFEIMPGHEMPDMSVSRSYGEKQKYITVEPFMSTSLQVAPGIPKGISRPINGEKLNISAGQKWYSNLKIPNLANGKSDYNYGFWGQESGPEWDPTWDQVYKYVEDAISINTNLEETHFDEHHVYRLEWEPGPKGYLEWYLDDKLIFGIPGESLQSLTGSQIPDEPMYLILNTAISHRWGFPEPCDISTCSACWVCYDCTHPDCQCSLPNGMKNCKNLPAEMSIDYIRLYQDTSKDSLHSLGCSPESHPTKEYIEANYAMYKNWEPYKGSTTFLSLTTPSVSDFSFIYLLHIIGAFGLVVILIFGLYRLYQIIYRCYYPYRSLSQHNSFEDNHLLPISQKSTTSNVQSFMSLSGGHVTTSGTTVTSTNGIISSQHKLVSPVPTSVPQPAGGKRKSYYNAPYNNGQNGSNGNMYVTVENEDMIALVTVPSPSVSGRSSYQNSSTNLSEINLNIRRSRGREDIPLNKS